MITIGIIALADAIKDMGAMTSLNISNNAVVVQDVTINAPQQGLQKGGQVNGRMIKEVYDNGNIKLAADFSGVVAVANAIMDNRAMTTLNISGTKLFNDADEGASVGKVLGAILQTNSTLRELDVSNSMQVSNSPGGSWFAKELAVGLCDNGALSIANVMGNKIGKEQLTKLQEIMRSKPNLVSLCGIADDAIEADLSGLGMDADDAAVLASELPDKGALASLNISSNNLAPLVYPGGWKSVNGNNRAPFVGRNGQIQQKDPRLQDVTGLRALADAISNTSLTSLDISNNSIADSNTRHIERESARRRRSS
jgi:hypothetical protein